MAQQQQQFLAQQRQQEFENSLRMREHQRQIDNDNFNRWQTLQQLQEAQKKNDQTFGFKQQTLQDQNQRATDANNVRLAIAGASQQAQSDKMALDDSHFQQTYGLRKDQVDANESYHDQQLALRSQRIQQIDDEAKARLAAGQDARQVAAARQQAISQDRANQFNAGANNTAARQAVSNAQRELASDGIALGLANEKDPNGPVHQRVRMLQETVKNGPAIQTVTPSAPAQPMPTSPQPSAAPAPMPSAAPGAPAAQPATQPAKPAQQQRQVPPQIQSIMRTATYGQRSLTTQELKALVDFYGGNVQAVYDEVLKPNDLNEYGIPVTESKQFKGDSPGNPLTADRTGGGSPRDKADRYLAYDRRDTKSPLTVAEASKLLDLFGRDTAALNAYLSARGLTVK